MPPGELLPDPKLLITPPSEGLLRDPAQLPGCWGKGTKGPWIVQEMGRVLMPSEGPLPRNSAARGTCERRQRERHIEDTPTDPVDSERAAHRHANLRMSQPGTRGEHSHRWGHVFGGAP